MDIEVERFSARRLVFGKSAPDTGVQIILAVILFKESGIPLRAVVRENPGPAKRNISELDKEVVGAVCEELRSIEDDQAALRSYVNSLGESNWSLTLTDPNPLLATTFEAALTEASQLLWKRRHAAALPNSGQNIGT